MEENCMIEVVGQSESDSETILKTSETGTVVYKHVACQAASSLTSEVLVPIMFCTLFSPICEASIQVNLPITSIINYSHSPPTVTPSFSAENRKSEYKRVDHIKSVKKRKKCFKTQTYRKGKDETSSLHSDSQEPEDGASLSPSPEEDYVEKDPEDSEYTSDNDLAFWQKMKKHAKRKNKKSSRSKLYLKYPSHINHFRNERINCSSRKCHITVQRCSDQQSAVSKEDSKTLDEASTAVKGPGSGDDWITDDEMDDEDQENIELAFKREWKEKRLPWNSKEKNFVCEICGKQYSKHSYLRGHIVREHKEHEEAKRYPYSCQHCKKVYMRERHLLHHQQQHSGPCEICGVVLKCSGLFWIHRRNHDSVCKVCNRTFGTKASVDMHMRLKHSEKSIPCPECNRKFPFEFLKNRHIAKVHNNPELTRYKCDRCDFWALAEVALKIHQRRMHNSKLDIYSCKECKSTFKSRLTYNNHVANHIGKSSIVCLLCFQKFTSEGELQAHRNCIHGITDEVHIKETTSSHLNNSNVSQYLCALCNITLGSPEDLAQHIHQYHDMDIDSPRDIKVEVGPLHCTETYNKNTESIVQTVGSEETNLQESDKPIRNEAAVVNFSTELGCSSVRSALLMPASVVPPNVNMVEINGMQYHVLRGSK